ncbi:MAG: bifunctional UDP-N-acetylglucosamine diphosphorylase/glucosamine-1-phosphate N-acetyltransferase GlmU, partial [Pseudomonadota bacterium]
TRMRSAVPKVMHKVAGLPMVRHVLAAVDDAGIDETALVVAPDSEWAHTLPEKPQVFVQDPPRGTAHAVLAARTAFDSGVGALVVLFGDNPLITRESIHRALAAVTDDAEVCVLAFEAPDPSGYGRVLTEDGKLVAIREERDASAQEKSVTLCNSGIMAIRGSALAALGDIGDNNAKGEFYLTDLVEVGRAKGFRMVVERAPVDEVMGVNDRAQLAEAEAAFQARARRLALAHATLEAPSTVFFSHDTVLGDDVTVEPNVVFGPGVVVREGAQIRAFSHLEGAVVGAGAIVGPYARLRPGSVIGDNGRIGNFVEIKNATLGEGAKANHLSYVGDASVGAGANLGAGTITCNYDGENKHRTIVGEGAFIGSNSALVAPVTIGTRAYVGSGSVITQNVPSDALAIARGRQVTKPDRSPAAKSAASRGKTKH